MNTNISADVLSVNLNTSVTENLLILALYVVGCIFLFRYSFKQSKKYKYISLENYWLFKKKLASYKNNAKTDDSKDIKITPVQAGFIVDEKINRNHIIATILHFLDLGIIKLEKIYRNDKTFAYRFEKMKWNFVIIVYIQKRILP